MKRVTCRDKASLTKEELERALKNCCNCGGSKTATAPAAPAVAKKVVNKSNKTQLIQKWRSAQRKNLNHMLAARQSRNYQRYHLNRAVPSTHSVARRSVHPRSHHAPISSFASSASRMVSPKRERNEDLEEKVEEIVNREVNKKVKAALSEILSNIGTQ